MIPAIKLTCCSSRELLKGGSWYFSTVWGQELTKSLGVTETIRKELKEILGWIEAGYCRDFSGFFFSLAAVHKFTLTYGCVLEILS